MITRQQKARFETFGFLFVEQAFSGDEIGEVIDEAERLWEQDRRRPDFKKADDGSQHTGTFVELSSRLSTIVEDDRVHETVDQLIGPDVVWTGSEGNVTGYGSARWHPDRRNHGPGHLDYPQLKVMLYLDDVSADKGALRVIPGSHRNPLHDSLYPMLDDDWQPIPEADDPTDMPFGLAGDQMPCQVVTSRPGDMLFFNQCLFHAAYNAWSGRRYIALKFAAKPTEDVHLAALRRYSPNAFTPHRSFLNSDSPRIKGIVRQLAEVGAT